MAEHYSKWPPWPEKNYMIYVLWEWSENVTSNCPELCARSSSEEGGCYRELCREIFTENCFQDEVKVKVTIRKYLCFLIFPSDRKSLVSCFHGFLHALVLTGDCFPSQLAMLLPDHETPFLLLGCLVQPWCKGLSLVLLHLGMSCVVDITGRTALFWRKSEKQLIWGRREVGDLEGREYGNIV